MVAPRQGDIWWIDVDDKRRPVLVVTRNRIAARLNRIVVAPITRTVRGVDTEVPVGRDEGLREASVASFDKLRLVPRHRLTERIGSIGPRRDEICRALAALADCGAVDSPLR